MIVCRCNWYSAGSLAFQMPKYNFQLKYTEAKNLSISTWKLSWFAITKKLTAVLKDKFIVSFIIVFGTLSFPIEAKLSHQLFISSFVDN